MRRFRIPDERAWGRLRVAARDRRSVNARPPQMRGRALPRPPLGLLVRRLGVWTVLAARFYAGELMDGLLLRRHPRRTAARAVALLSGAGPTAVKVGKQLAARLDLMPVEVVDALDQLRDEMPGFDAEVAIARVEAVAGHRIEQLCSAFDPTPIVEEIASCVWQAELRTGQKVAFRVRRPGIAERLAADHVALLAVAGGVALFTALRVDQVDTLRKELAWVLDEELDFVRIARFQRRMRTELRRTGPRRVGVARVLRRLSGEEVIATEFVPGVWLDELIAAREAGDEPALAQLAVRGIEPRQVARRLLHFGWWCMFDNRFHPVHPSVGDVVVQDGGRVVLVDVGACSMTPGRKRLLGREVVARLAENDVSGSAEAFVELLSPLPFLDSKELAQKVEGALWPALFAMRNRKLPWVERTSAGVWLGAMRVGQAYSARFRLEILRLMRASIQMDLLAAQVWPQTNLLGQFRRYEEDSRLRRARRGLRRVRRWLRRPPHTLLSSQVERDVDTVRRLELLLRLFLDEVPLDFQALSKKGAYAWGVLLQAGVSAATVTAALAFGVWALEGFAGSFPEAGLRVLTHPVYAVLGVLAFVAVARVVIFRLDDRE